MKIIFTDNFTDNCIYLLWLYISSENYALCYYRSRGDTNSESILHSELIRENSLYLANLELDVDKKYKMVLLWSDKDMNESARTYIKDI